jgi:hypothetical protein
VDLLWIFRRFGSVFDLGRFWIPSGSKTALSGVVNPELQFEFEEKDKKREKPRKIRGLKQKNKNQLGHLVTTFRVGFTSVYMPNPSLIHTTVVTGTKANTRPALQFTLGLQGWSKPIGSLTPSGILGGWVPLQDRS